MPTDEAKAVLNQKVFVSLVGFTKLVQEYNRTCREFERQKAEGKETATWMARKSAFEYVFATLSLPVLN